LHLELYITNLSNPGN